MSKELELVKKINEKISNSRKRDIYPLLEFSSVGNIEWISFMGLTLWDDQDGINYNFIDNVKINLLPRSMKNDVEKSSKFLDDFCNFTIDERIIIELIKECKRMLSELTRSL